MKNLGQESNLHIKGLSYLSVNLTSDSKITQYPKVGPEKNIICAFNRCGIDGMADMIICESLQDMQQLQNEFNNGMALQISWFTAPISKTENQDVAINISGMNKVKFYLDYFKMQEKALSHMKLLETSLFHQKT